MRSVPNDKTMITGRGPHICRREMRMKANRLSNLRHSQVKTNKAIKPRRFLSYRCDSCRKEGTEVPSNDARDSTKRNMVACLLHLRNQNSRKTEYASRV